MIALLLVLSVFFHTATQLDEWFEDWSTRVDNDYLSGLLLAELDDMQERHPYWGDPPVTSSTTSRPSSSGMGGNTEQWRSLVEQHFNSEDVWRVLCLMAHESVGNELAYNPSGASGLMQILASWADDFGYVPTDLFNPSVNLFIARQLRDSKAGWNHWNPYQRGLCR